jgi:5'-nucleotidase
MKPFRLFARWPAALTVAFAPFAAFALCACLGDDSSATPTQDGGQSDVSASGDGPKGDAAQSEGGPSPDGQADSAPAESGAPDAGAVVNVQVLAFNDFHGNLRPPSPSNAVVLAPAGDPAISDAGSPTPTQAGTVDGGVNVQIYAGGASYLGAKVTALRAINPNTLLVSAGDLTGASPLISNAFDDEPTIQVMNAIGLDINGVGNHEFDHGPNELLRLQNGGCNYSDRMDAGPLFSGSCEADPTFPGANFQYLSANVDVNVSPKKTLFPPYVIKSVGGARVAFIGMTLKSTPTIVSPLGTAGLAFDDEVDTVNLLVPVLKQQMNVDAIIVLVHQGGFQSGTYNECLNFSGGSVPAGAKDIIAIADGLDSAVDAVASAHTHVAYNCNRNGRPLTSAASYGRIITQFNFTIDTGRHLVTAKTAENVVVTRDQTPDSTVEALVQRYATLIAPIAERRVGQISGDVLRFAKPNGEAPLGDVIADALLDAGATNGAVVGFTNIGGVRDSLLFKQYYSEGDGTVTFEKAQAVTPFGNKVVILSCTGQNIIDVIQQNVYAQAGGGTKVLQVSSGFTFTWSAATAAADPTGQNAAMATTIAIGGTPVDPAATYTLATTDFLAAGGDGYTVFQSCTPVTTLPGVDLKYFADYLTSKETPPLDPPPATRITKGP